MKLRKDENTVRTNSQRYLHIISSKRYLSLIYRRKLHGLCRITKRDARHTAQADKALHRKVEVPPTHPRNSSRRRLQIRSNHRIRYALATIRKPEKPQ